VKEGEETSRQMTEGKKSSRNGKGGKQATGTEEGRVNP